MTDCCGTKSPSSNDRDEPLILIADDQEEDVLFLERVLRETGVVNPIFITRDGQETISYLKGEGGFACRSDCPLPSILFLDVWMPNLNGIAVLKWLQSQDHLADLLTVVISETREIQIIDRAYSLGAKSCLVKPVKKADVLNLVHSFTGRWKMKESL